MVQCLNFNILNLNKCFKHQPLMKITSIKLVSSTKMLKGIQFKVNGRTVFVPAVLAPAPELFGFKIIKLQNLHAKNITQGFGKWFFENVLQKINGFENIL
eukprot:TRINITY_DN8397_c0_g4_i2.p3 TRINITY_DN8397_c0_g4~~TRINITY_DN8397_c0_g4_i2.p3  ORF type:complete len:100 (-),score=5.68 TRINITY_DN8397_c0_g4_i2:17-316(-)